ncbi:hypothetical protein ACJX0J_021597, partial [Zea mays]
MGKYMRKRRGAAGEGVAAVEVSQVVGVRTRSRSAAATGGGVAKVAPPRRKKALLPAANVTTSGEPGAVGAGGGDGGSCCYIHLRSRMLFMAAPQQQPSAALTPVEAAGAAQQGGVVALAAGLSRCSSTASSVDVGGHACRSDAAPAEVDGDHVPDVVTASNSGSVPDRERRETTPSSSRAHGGELSDLESDLVGRQKTGCSSSPATTTSAAELIVPPAQEIQEFFAAAEAAHAKRFAS